MGTGAEQGVEAGPVTGRGTSGGAGTAWGGAGTVGLAWGGAILLAGLGTATAFEAAGGVNWGIWTTVAGLGLLALARRRARELTRVPVDPVAAWCVFLAILVAWGAAVTASDLFQFFIVVACVTLLAVATRVISGVPGDAVGSAVVVRAPFAALGAVTAEAGRLSMNAATGARRARHAPVVRGIALAVPVAALFALVLAGADPTLTTWTSRLWDVVRTMHFIPRVVFFAGLGTIVLGAYGLALRPPAAGAGDAVRRTPGLRIGATERRIVVGAVALVFGAFLAMQFTYLFRDTRGLRVSGLTYADDAHRGFVELTIAATLAVALVVALDRHTTSSPSERGRAGPLARWGTLVLITEVLVVLMSALHRLSLYEAAYGYTMLRLYVQAYVVGVAIALLLLAAEVLGLSGRFDEGRFARRTGWSR